MRFRRIEKEGPGAANVGLDQQHMQGKEDDVSVSESKTYIGSNTKKKVDMNKIKNTKIGDDIHYYVNGVEGRGIVVKMGSQYLDLFQQDGNIQTVNINDTFFVKDILINKQWDDMDDAEKYESLQKIHAPTPRFITKSWSALPEEIKDLLRKDGVESGSVDKKKAEGHTYEEGETKDSETQDHARTGFAQNTQYDPSVKEKSLEELEKYGKTEHQRRYEREQEEKKTGKIALGNPKYYTLDNPQWGGDEKKIPKSQLEGGKGQWQGAERMARKERLERYGDTDVMRKRDEEEYQKHVNTQTAAASQNKDKEIASEKERKAEKLAEFNRKNPTVAAQGNKKVPGTHQLDEIIPQGKETPKKEKPTTGGFVTEDMLNEKAYNVWLQRRKAYKGEQ